MLIKNPVTPLGIETATFRLEAPYFNQPRHHAQDHIKMDLI
jgi:hypothetical protein